MESLARALAAHIPDEPRWIDIRGMLLSPHAVVSGGDSAASGFVVRVAHGAVSSVGVVGQPPAAAIRDVLGDLTALTPVVCQTADAPHVRRVLTGWSEEPAVVHTLHQSTNAPGRDGSRPTIAPAAVRLLSADERSQLAHLPPPLRHEMTAALDLGPLAAVFVDDRAVAFCYAVWRTESWWDVSIDTLEAYRRRGFAEAAVHAMRDVMRAAGREPIWSALVSNIASLRLAAKLGFWPVDGFTVFSREGRWTLLSGGYTEGGADPRASTR